MFRNIMVAFDGSEEADAALDVAAALALDLRAKLTVAAVSPSADHDGRWNRALREALGRVPDEVVSSEHALFHGSAGPALAAGATAQEVDLIVAGSRDHEEPRPLAFSVARYLVDNAPCPVLVVRHGARVSREPSLAAAAERPATPGRRQN